mgnify:FL=1
MGHSCVTVQGGASRTAVVFTRVDGYRALHMLICRWPFALHTALTHSAPSKARRMLPQAWTYPL